MIISPVERLSSTWEIKLGALLQNEVTFSASKKKENVIGYSLSY